LTPDVETEKSNLPHFLTLNEVLNIAAKPARKLLNPMKKSFLYFEPSAA